MIRVLKIKYTLQRLRVNKLLIYLKKIQKYCVYVCVCLRNCFSNDSNNNFHVINNNILYFLQKCCINKTEFISFLLDLDELRVPKKF